MKPNERNDIGKEKRAIISELGPWTTCIHLNDGSYTFERPQVPQPDNRLRRFLQVAADITCKPLHELRVLDLACLEGAFGIEFALHGARVLGIEGRKNHLAKAQFVKNVLSLDNLEFALDDVRNVNRSKHGSFDVVLCLGILYHLDVPDVMEFLKRIFDLCTRVTIIDTHISLSDRDSCDWNDATYWGTFHEEHRSGTSPEEKQRAIWMSLDNERSFHFTKPSLCNLLKHIGFTSVYEVMNPYEYHNPNWPLDQERDRYAVWKDRLTLAAVKGTRQKVISSPVTDASSERDRPEQPEFLIGPGSPDKPPRMRRRLSRILPPQLTRFVRQLSHRHY